MKFRRKAISPLIATVLLIGFAITIAALINNFSAGFITGQQTSATEKTTATLNCAYGKLKINSAAYNGTSGALKIRVTNEDANTQDSALANITFSVITPDSSNSTGASCNCADESLYPGETKFYTASISGGCNITSVFVSSSCPNAKDSVAFSGIDFTDC